MAKISKDERQARAEARKKGGARPSTRQGRVWYMDEKSRMGRGLPRLGSPPKKAAPKKAAKPRPRPKAQAKKVPRPSRAPSQPRLPMPNRRTGKPGAIAHVTWGKAKDRLGDVVLAALKGQGLNVSDLARLISKGATESQLKSTRVQLAYWLEGKRHVRSDVVVGVFEALEIDVGDPLIGASMRNRRSSSSRAA